MRANSLSASSKRRFRVLHFGHRVRRRTACPAVRPSRASICAAFASASLSCASVSVDGDAHELGARRHRRAALDRRRDDAAGGFGGDVGLLFGRQAAGRADEARDRLLDGGGRRDRDGGRRGVGCSRGLAVGRAARRRRQHARRASERGPSERICDDRAIHETTPRVMKPGHRRRVRAMSSGQPTPAGDCSATPDCRPASVTFEHVAGELVGVLAGHEPIRQPQHGDAEHADHQQRATRRADRPWRGRSPASMHALKLRR